jgi:LPS export ABC transporter permease LptG
LIRPAPRPLFLSALLAVAGLAVGGWLVPAESAVVTRHLLDFPDAHAPTHGFRPMVVAILCGLPALAVFCYALGDTLDRYMTRQFAGIFGITLGSLALIWMLADLNDNLRDFRDSRNMAATIARFYLARSPSILLTLLPYSLLLSLIYTLGKLSKEREFIAMIQSGRGILRITLPLVVAGFFATLLCTGLNYHWAPSAEGNRDAILKRARGLPVAEATDVLYFNSENRRLWMIGMFPEHYERGEPLQNLEITRLREDHSVHSRLSATRATWNRKTRVWTFEGAVLARFEPGEPPAFETFDNPVTRAAWDETPFQLIRPGLSPSYLGVPALTGWLANQKSTHPSHTPAAYLTQWHYRWALPFTCLVTVLLATPLSIHFSRRGSGGGVFLAVVLSALLLVLSSVTLALGESDIIAPAFAAWLPNLIFTVIGIYLYQRRIAGRPIYHEIRRLFVPG